VSRVNPGERHEATNALVVPAAGRETQPHQDFAEVLAPRYCLGEPLLRVSPSLHTSIVGVATDMAARLPHAKTQALPNVCVMQAAPDGREPRRMAAACGPAELATQPNRGILRRRTTSAVDLDEAPVGC